MVAETSIMVGFLFILTAFRRKCLKVGAIKILPIFLEAVGIVFVCLGLGLNKSLWSFLALLLFGCVLAIFLDPYIWKRQGLGEVNDKSKQDSLIINGALGFLGTLAFVITYFLF